MINSNQIPKPRLWNKLRFPWQRRPNVLVEAIVLPRTIHEPINTGNVPIPTSEIHIHEVGLSQRWNEANTEKLFMQEWLDSDKAPNILDSESLSDISRFQVKPEVVEPSNHRSTLLPFFMTMPTLDAKDASDWEATLPNKDVLPLYQPDSGLTRQLEFLRFLIKKGIISEGVEGDSLDEQPHPYNDYYNENRALYSDSDKPDFKIIEDDEDTL